MFLDCSLFSLGFGDLVLLLALLVGGHALGGLAFLLGVGLLAFLGLFAFVRVLARVVRLMVVLRVRVVRRPNGVLGLDSKVLFHVLHELTGVMVELALSHVLPFLLCRLNEALHLSLTGLVAVLQKLS